MKPGRRLVYRAAALFYIALFAAIIWPVYPRFATIEPRVLALPFSLVYVVAALLVSFGALTCLYLWEGPDADAPGPGEAGDGTERFHPGGRD